WSPKSESSREMLDYLIDSGVAGQRIAVQLHGATDNWDPVPELLDELCAADADVVPIRVYRWRVSPPGGKFDQLITQIAHRQYDAVSFTSAPAVVATLTRAGELGILDEVLGALRSGVHAMCVGPVTASPLTRLGIPTSSPQRMRLGALARHIADQLPTLRTHTVYAAGHHIEIRSTCVLVDGVVRPLSPTGMATLRALAQHPGTVVARDELLQALSGNGSDTHAVETAVLRLRTALGDKDIIATVVKRGYRLAVDEQSGAA
ncbi:MAG: uroporphyrinogen-III synthase, partial [Mycobacterium sp.]